MACLTTDPNGSKRVLVYVCGTRKTIRLGKGVSDRIAEEAADNISALAKAKTDKQPLPLSARTWLNDAPRTWIKRLDKVGVIPAKNGYWPSDPLSGEGKTDSYSYFVMSPDGSVVKIGWTGRGDPALRIREVLRQSHTFMRPIAVMRSSRQRDVKLRRHFRHILYKKSDWFLTAKELMAYIDKNAHPLSDEWERDVEEFVANIRSKELA